MRFTPAHIHAFRLRRHHLLDRTGKDLVTICREICGVQAQIMSAAQLQLWARNAAITVHLLPYFDVYLLAHSLKDHLVDSHLYKRVYRNQGWISPVVLIDGKVAGVWAYELGRQDIQVGIELFARVTRSHREQIKARAHSLAELFQRTLSLSFRA